MHRTAHLHSEFAIAHDPDVSASLAAQRSNRRRRSVFLLVFAATLLPGLIWNFTRPAEYRTSARLEITPGTTAPRNDNAVPAPPTAEQANQKVDLLVQAQLLTSRNLLQAAAERMGREGLTPALSEDPVSALQHAISAAPVANTDIVELQAIGRSPEWLAKAVNTLIEVYREQLLAAHDDESTRAIADLRAEVERLGNDVNEKRAQLQAFRAQTGVISSERGENQALARAKGLADSLNKANEDAAKAEARLRTLQDSAASGRSPVQAKDNPTLALIEQRISATREQLRDMERTYTASFMEMDPTARALRARLAELEQQLSSSRTASQRTALAAAEEDAAGARATVARIRAQIDGLKKDAQVFSGQFLEAQSMEADMARLEGARRNASERLARLAASEGARRPKLGLLEAAVVPQSPWRPDYWRDALINLAASFALGLLAVWFVELFNRAPNPTPAATTTLVLPQPWMAPALGNDHEMPPALAAPRELLPQLPANILPRELSQDEVAALLAGADPEGRLLCAVMLLGLRTEEARQLTAEDVDVESQRLSVGTGAARRSVPLTASLAAALAALGEKGSNAPLFDGDFNTHIACSAIDAGLGAPASITPEVLRHTCIASLLTQRVRFSSLARLVGNLSQQELAAYAEYVDGPRPPGDEAIDPIMPALRRFEAWQPHRDA